MTLTELLQQNPGLLAGIVFCFGLLVGSFLNVVILRLPARMTWEFRQQCQDISQQQELPFEAPPDLVFKRSHCPQCHHQLKVHENIPVLSYLLLRGRCSGCGTAISLQYPLIELATGLLSAFVAYRFGFSLTMIGVLLLTWGLIALTMIDIREQLLPDIMTLPLLWLGLLLNVSNTFTSTSDAIIGAVAGYLCLWVVYQTFKRLTGKEGMGYGDFKLMALFGAWLGWQMLPLIILLSSLVAALVGITLILIQGRDKNLPIAFGPYIAAAGWIALFWGDWMLDAYVGVTSP